MFVKDILDKFLDKLNRYQSKTRTTTRVRGNTKRTRVRVIRLVYMFFNKFLLHKN
jgi:hypothetical protein